MQEAITPITQRFMDFIARVFVPQSVFFIFFMLLDFCFSDFKYSNILLNQFLEHWKASVFLILILSIGWGFVVAFINQIYDKFNSENYDPLFSGSDTSSTCYELKTLRKDVIGALKEDNQLPFSENCETLTIKDRHLYEILGNTTIFPTLGNVISFNDKANHSYTFVTTLLINLAFFLFCTTAIESDKITKIIIYVVSFSVLFVSAVYIARKHYRERNIRLYINYLMERGSKHEKNQEKAD